jgi:tetratricopeptide (TPR) repeat protein
MPAIKEELTVGDRINNFVQKNRRTIFICLGVVVLILAGLIGGITIRDSLQKRAISRVEEFNRRYEELRFTIAEESNMEPVAVLLADISAFAPKNSGYSGSRAYALIAGIHQDKKEWAEAEQAWREAAKKAGKTYLAPVAFFNAASAAEAQGKIPEAIALYTECLTLADSFPSSPRAQFAIGRLEEEQGNVDAALAAYQALKTRWPNDTLWRNLAQSRILDIEGERY